MKTQKNPHISKDFSDNVKKNKDKEFLKKFENALLHAAGLSGVYYCGPWEDDVLIWDNPKREKKPTSKLNIPIPPLELRHFYGRDNDEMYLKAGQNMYKKYKDLYNSTISNFIPGDNILEIGCSSGRILRWFEDELNIGLGVYGADIDSSAIIWAQQNLDERFNFFINTTTPHLPFPDNYFSMIYGNSLFTHIGELSEFWFLEIWRILDTKRGIAVITINDDRSISYLKSKYQVTSKIPFMNPRKAIELDESLSSEGREWGKLVFNSSPWQQSVWYKREYLINRLTSMFVIVDIVEKFDGYQNAYIIKKKA